MDFRDARIILENIEALDDEKIQLMFDSFDLSGIGEYIEYTFRDATSPDDLQSGITGMFREITEPMRLQNDISVAQQYGISNMSDMRQFYNLMVAVNSDPQRFFNLYKETDVKLDEVGDPKLRLAELQKVLQTQKLLSSILTGAPKDRAMQNIASLERQIASLEKHGGV